MAFEDLYPVSLNTEGDPAHAVADECVYRLVLRRLLVPGLPELVTVGDVEFHFVTGPVRTQRTAVRQRPSWPPVYDKHMQRAVLVGANEPVTVCQLRSAMPDALPSAIEGWRSRVQAAVGVACVTLDERIALDQLAEDVVLLLDGRAVAAADVERAIRVFMPFDVTDADASALASLGDLALDSAAAGAAHLLATGLQRGPTAEGFLFLWLAIDSVVGTHGTQKAAVARALAEAGADLSWLNLPLGRLVGLRGPVAHGRDVDPDLLKAGYYDAEAIGRLLVRRALGIDVAWPAAPTPIAFPLPLGRRIAEQRSHWTEVFHQEGLPEPETDVDLHGLPRVDALVGGHREWLRVVRAPSADVEERIVFWSMVAVNALEIDVGPFEIRVADPDLPEGREWAVNRDVILMSTGVAAGPDDEGEPRMAWNLLRLVAEMQVMRTGVESVDFGAFLIDFGGAWIAYREWFATGELDSSLITRVPFSGASMQDLGAMTGIAAAGDAQARAELDAWLAEASSSERAAGAIAELMPFLSAFEKFDDYLELCRQMVAAESAARSTGPAA